jgi:RsbT co-antagonist protein rsbRD N-terminal domain
MAESANPAPVAGGTAGAVVIESVADILERDLDAVIQEWLTRVDKEPELTAIPLSFEDRTGHLPQLLRDVIVRLRLDDETKAEISQAAAHHGDLRAKQGYTVAMAVEESRLLHTCARSTGDLTYNRASGRRTKYCPLACWNCGKEGTSPHHCEVARIGFNGCRARCTKPMPAVPEDPHLYRTVFVS